MASGVVVVKAAERSGSLISARTAGEQGREVMAIPGSPLDPRSAGTNRLLREGATLVRNAEDVIEALSSIIGGSVMAPERPEFGFEQEEADIPETQIDAVLNSLSPHPMSIDDIARAAKVGPGRCAAILVELELSGRAITLPGGLACLSY
jgi:DNA processing protein